MACELSVERISLQEIASNVALSRAVGWSDSEAEWRTLHEAALVLGVRCEGELVGQGGVGMFEGAATIAKMVVSIQHRQRGIGGAILDALLVEAERRGLSVQGLVATPLGQPLYHQRGFETVGDVVIAVGSAPGGGAAERVPEVAHLEQIASIERRFMTGSRAAMLSGLLRESCASALLPGGFALACVWGGGFRLGPIIADSEPTARSLTLSLLQSLAGPVRFDLPGEQHRFRIWLRGLGFVEKGVHVEMARGGALPWNVPQRFGLATQAWG